MLLDARARTLSLTLDLTGSQLLGPRLTIVNPPLWEIGHLGVVPGALVPAPSRRPT